MAPNSCHVNKVTYQTQDGWPVCNKDVRCFIQDDDTLDLLTVFLILLLKLCGPTSYKSALVDSLISTKDEVKRGTQQSDVNGLPVSLKEKCGLTLKV